MTKHSVQLLTITFVGLCISTTSAIANPSGSTSILEVRSSQSATPPTASQSIKKTELQTNKRYFISRNALNVRASNSITEKNIVGQLSANDEVELVDLLSDETPLVEIKIIRSASVRPNVASQLYVSKDYLGEKIVLPSKAKYFIIQNIATEKTRVYERCTESLNCPHRMVLETDMVVGRPEVGRKDDPHAFKTWVGHAQISEWVKFYQDTMAHYPRWYSIGQDFKTIPQPLTVGFSKVAASQKWIVPNEEGQQSIYGAFGWYAAKLYPSDEIDGVNYQWIHGTIGWGRDGSTSIDLTRSFLLNLISDPGSSGCTRLENRAVAYLRSFLEPGTDVYRIYARESTREKEVISGFFKRKTTPLSRYAGQFNQKSKWDYILLTDGAENSGGLTSDAKTIIARAIPVIPGQNLIEQGSYEIDGYPNAMPLNYEQTAFSGKSGDRYEIDKGENNSISNFRGFFLVDEGRFIDYQHPDTLETDGAIRVGGLPDFRSQVPDFLKTEGDHNPPEVTYRKNPYSN